jgi:hypothetical protein
MPQIMFAKTASSIKIIELEGQSGGFRIGPECVKRGFYIQLLNEMI